jgi:L,D-transpeptidase YbiS
VHIEINIGSQMLTLFNEEQQLMTFVVATARKGVGEQNGSEQTPRGWHLIRAKIGADQPVNTVFVGRRPTGEIYSPALGAQAPERDWILTRILWLSGLEPGRSTPCAAIFIFTVVPMRNPWAFPVPTAVLKCIIRT